MATEIDVSKPEFTISPQNAAMTDLGNSLANMSSQDETGQPESGDAPDIQKFVPSRPLMIYTRPQILRLHESPLVKPPPDMPALKDWFGTENEQTLSKKEPEPSATSATRDRRFRRDPEDGETVPRPTFRSALSQPSQMGNFKHQSSRGSDRDRDRDVDKDRERDIRDKEGQERLRNLSDKYDRERLAFPATLGVLRTKEKDQAPHLAAVSSSSRTSAPAQTPTPTIASRRADAREAAKKKSGEVSEDWRRGADARSAREDRQDVIRKDREERERPRSRVRDTSRSRRDPSLLGRDPDYYKDRDRLLGRELDGDKDKERDGERDRDRVRVRDSDRLPSPYYTRADRDRDRERERARDKDRRYIRLEPRDQRDDLRRDDKELDLELDDPRRWRDDGKRDERLAARDERAIRRERLSEQRERLSDQRDLRNRERAREKALHEPGNDAPPDRRWTVVEERDGRSKRSSGRDRRSGVAGEGKDKDEPKDRDREKEPAWMDTYIPSASNGGILGGKGDGELDGIQVWKKGMKEKERRDKRPSKDEEPAEADLPAVSEKPEAPEKQLDEIQMFKLMMKREEERKKNEKPDDSPLDESRPSTLLSESVPSLVKLRDQRKASSPGDNIVSPAPRHIGEELSVPALPSESSSSTPSPQNHIPPAANASDGPRTLLSILASSSSPESIFTANSNTSSLGASLDRAKATGSRLASNSLSPESILPASRSLADPAPASSTAPVQFQPPQGSRLLAFGARAPPAAPASQTVKSQTPLPNGLHSQISVQQTLHHPSAPPNNPLQNVNASSLKPDALPAQQGFSPFEDPRGAGNYPNHPDALRRTSIASSADRVVFNAPSDTGSYSDLSGGISSNISGLSTNHTGSTPESVNPSGGNTYASGKGSRFAKFFDAKGRDGPPVKAQTPPVGFSSSSPIPGPRQDQGNLNGMLGGNNIVEDLFAMLNNSSSQTQRGNPVNPAQTGGLSFGQGHSLHSLQQQQMHQQHQHQQHQHPHQHQHQQQHPSNTNSRLDSLYESRVDDRNFVPDGMVPGLRSVLPPRSRENGGMFTDPLEEPMPFNPQRLPPQRSLDQMYSGPYQQAAGIGRNVGIPLQQPHYRGGPSPISSQNSLQGPPQQRLPPGLANLGGRPPHEPSQFLGMPGMQTAGLHGALHGNGSSPQGFNNFAAAGGGLNYGGGPQIRLPPPPHQMQNPHTHNQMTGLGHPSNMDLRGPSQAQLLGMGGGIGGLRSGSGGFGPQQGPNAQMQAPLIGMRQQQQQQQQHQHQHQHLPPHMMPHLLPPHLQQGIPGTTNQPAHDLMALLMGGTHRE